MNQSIKLNITKISIIFAIALAVLSGIYFVKDKSDSQIKNFDKQRDSQFIYDSFKKDLYWLVENPQFSVDFMINTMSPNTNHPEYFGKLNFKVLFENGQHAGFTTYYMKKFYEGTVQFIFVDPKFRNKGYAKKLVRYASNELFKMGASIVKLVTRVNNTPAIKAYEKAGFKITGDDGKFVDMQISKEQL